MMPFMGRRISLQAGRAVSASKLARPSTLCAAIADAERLTAQIATAIDENPQSTGRRVLIEAEHMCMSLRGVEKLGASTITTQSSAPFRTIRRAGSIHDAGAQG